MSENKIQLTESELRHMVERVCRSVIREELQRYLITEMAMSVKDYRTRVEGLMPQILENWCLIRYSTLTGERQEVKRHWKCELRAHINNIASIKLKNGNSKLTKQNALYTLWNMYDWDTDENCIARRLCAKFDEENLPTNGEAFARVVEDFKNESKALVGILTSDSNLEVMEYIDSI